VKKIDSAPERSVITFKPKPSFEPIKLIQLIQKDGRYRLAGQDKIRIERPAATITERAKLLKEFFRSLV
jgi:transcription-repair coupling factor (superfamily II helicase)